MSKSGLDMPTNKVANATNIVALATKTSVAVAKLLLDFTRTPSPEVKCNYVFVPILSPGQ